MNSFEWNKIFGGILATALVIMVIRIVTEDMIFHHEAAEEDAFPIAVAAAEAPVAASEEEDKGPSLAELLASATPDDGERVFRQCRTCHTIDDGGANGTGPNLHGVVGRAVGSHEGFAYSAAMAGKGGDWDYAALDTFLASPRDFVPGTKMSFAGLKKASDRARVIAFLAANSPDAPPPPAVESDTATEEAPEETPAD